MRPPVEIDIDRQPISLATVEAARGALVRRIHRLNRLNTPITWGATLLALGAISMGVIGLPLGLETIKAFGLIALGVAALSVAVVSTLPPEPGDWQRKLRKSLAVIAALLSGGLALIAMLVYQMRIGWPREAAGRHLQTMLTFRAEAQPQDWQDYQQWLQAYPALADYQAQMAAQPRQPIYLEFLAARDWVTRNEHSLAAPAGAAG